MLRVHRPSHGPTSPSIVEEDKVVDVRRQECPSHPGGGEEQVAVGSTVEPEFAGRYDVVPTVPEQQDGHPPEVVVGQQLGRQALYGGRDVDRAAFR